MLGPADVPALAAGAALLAAGAPAPRHATTPVTAALVRHGPVRLTALTALPDDALVTAIGLLGGAEGQAWPGDAAWRAAVAVVEEQAGQRVAAVVPLAAGGVLAALHAAATLRVPCADAGAAGRGAGRLDLTLPALGGLAAEPVVAGLDGTEVVSVRRAGNDAAHRIAASVARNLGGAAVAAYPASAARCAGLVADGAVRGYLRAGGDLLRGTVPTAPLFSGTVADRADVAGTRRGTATVADEGGERMLRLDYEDTYLVATEDGVVRAATPDLICVLDADRGEPVPSAGLAVGTRVHLLVVPAEPRWLLRDGIAAAGPRRFGYDVDHVRTTNPTGTTHSAALEIRS